MLLGKLLEIHLQQIIKLQECLCLIILGADVLVGIRAAKTLLKGTKLVSTGKRGRLIEKQGDYSQAIKDFHQVKTQNVFQGVRYGVSNADFNVHIYQYIFNRLYL